MVRIRTNFCLCISSVRRCIRYSLIAQIEIEDEKRLYFPFRCFLRCRVKGIVESRKGTAVKTKVIDPELIRRAPSWKLIST